MFATSHATSGQKGCALFLACIIIAPCTGMQVFYNASDHFDTDFMSTSNPGLPALPLSTQDTRVVDKEGAEVPLSCVNWYGAHMEIFAVGGLHRQPLQALVSSIAEMGFNCIRLPFSLELWYEDPVVPEHALAANPELIGLTGMQLFDLVIQACTREGIMVVLNNHNSEAGWCCNANSEEGVWSTSKYTTQQWIEALEALTLRYKGRGLSIVGTDLRNEVHDVIDKDSQATTTEVTWGTSTDIDTDWKVASEAAGRAVLAADESMLVLVSGLCFSYDLRPLAANPPDLPSSRLLLTSHVYPWSHWWVIAENNGVNFGAMRVVAAVLLPLAAIALAALGWVGVKRNIVNKVRATEALLVLLAWGALMCSMLAGLSWNVKEGARRGGCAPATVPLHQAMVGAAAAAAACGGVGVLVLVWGCARRGGREEDGSSATELGKALPGGRHGRADAGDELLYTSLSQGASPACEPTPEVTVDADGGDKSAFSAVPGAPAQPLVLGRRAGRLRMGWLVATSTVMVVFILSGVLLWLAERRATYALLEASLDYQWALGDTTIPIFVGEFGTATGDGSWFGHVLRYLKERRLGWAYWAVDGGKWSEHQSKWRDETYGIWDVDYASIRDPQKLQDLQDLIRSGSQ